MFFRKPLWDSGPRPSLNECRNHGELFFLVLALLAHPQFMLPSYFAKHTVLQCEWPQNMAGITMLSR